LVAALALLSVTSCSSPSSSNTSSSTAAPKEEGSMGSTKWALADLQISARQVELSSPRKVRVGDASVQASRVIEFELSASAPIPARALDPVVVVGDHLVREYSYNAPNVIVFVEPVPDSLPDGQQVFFQWGTDAKPSERQATSFVFRAAQLPRIKR
jgi:hypothetical protein